MSRLAFVLTMSALASGTVLSRLLPDHYTSNHNRLRRSGKKKAILRRRANRK